MSGEMLCTSSRARSHNEGVDQRVLNRLQSQTLFWRTLLQVFASPWTSEASTRERWQFGALN